VNKDKVIELAMEEVGYKEGENNLNKFAPIAGLANNLPWCNSFICAIFIQAGLKQAIPITAAVASTEAWGLKFNQIVKLEEAKRGDLIIMDFTNSGRAQHIGLAINRYNPIKKTIHTVEGNTEKSLKPTARE
jgi:cell wall-associated NlpC family hydrolase